MEAAATQVAGPESRDFTSQEPLAAGTAVPRNKERVGAGAWGSPSRSPEGPAGKPAGGEAPDLATAGAQPVGAMAARSWPWVPYSLKHHLQK